MSSNKLLTKVALAELIEDADIYPRHAVDASYVQSLYLALVAGVLLPPPVIDRESRRIVDGWQRVRAYRRFLGPEGTLEVKAIAYKDRAAMITDAVALNAVHGRRLNAIDRTRCVIMLRTAGLTDQAIADALHVPKEHIEKLAVKLATAKAGNGVIPGTNKIALKRSVGHMAGQLLSKTQAKAHSMMPGTNFTLLAKQLCLAIREGLADLDSAKLVAQLIELRDLLNEQSLAVPEEEGNSTS